MKKSIIFLLVSLCAISHADNWPAWRGPRANGVTTETDLPMKWSATEHVVWKTPLPEGGNSTPIIWRDRVFLTQATDKGTKRHLLCFDRKDGRELWRHTVSCSKPELTHETNPYCGSSPVTDGELVIACFGSAGVDAVDFAGKLRWHRDLGEQRHIWGGGASPVLAGEKIFLNFGPGPQAALYCLQKSNGETLWKYDAAGPSGEPPTGGGKPQWIGSWSDPVLCRLGKHEELIMTWPERIAAHDLNTGKELWRCAGLTALVYTSPVIADDMVLGMSGYGGTSLAVKMGGTGDSTASRLWQAEKTRQRIGSPVIFEGYSYILTDPGVAECRSLADGKIVWEERLKGNGTTGQNWSSLVRSGDRLYAVNQGGDGFIFRAAPKFELLATNPLGEKVIGSIAVSDGQLFIRSYQHLWCIGSSP